MIDEGNCDKGFISNCKCECDKSCDIGEYLDYENCKCRKKQVEKLVEECTENIDENEIIYNCTLNDHKNVCRSCIIFCAFNHKHWYWHCFYWFLLVLKKWSHYWY